MNPTQPIATQPDNPVQLDSSQPVSTTQPPQPPTSATAVPIAQYPCYYLKGITVFGARKGVVSLYPGLLVMTNAASGQEVFRYPLSRDLRMRNAYGKARIRYVNGHQHKMLDPQYSFYFYNPVLIGLSYVFMFLAMPKARRFINSCLQAAAA
jgi:hypothetical protein